MRQFACQTGQNSQNLISIELKTENPPPRCKTAVQWARPPQLAVRAAELHGAEQFRTYWTVLNTLDRAEHSAVLNGGRCRTHTVLNTPVPATPLKLQVEESWAEAQFPIEPGDDW